MIDDRRVSRSKSLMAAALFAVMASAVQAHAQPAEPVFSPEYDAFVEQVRRDWSIPGVAIAVVKDDKVTTRSYGLRQYDRNTPVTDKTMFGIASVTKTFVSAALAKLAAEGKVELDEPVVKYLPDFKVADPWLSRTITIRDLLSHRSGLASYGDWPEEIAGLSEADLVKRMAHLDQAVPFRDRTYYNSITYVAAAQIIEKVSGKPWGQYIDEEIWTPAGMNDSYAHADDFIAAANVLPTGDGWSDKIKIGQDAVPDRANVATPHVQWERALDRSLAYLPSDLTDRMAHFHRTAIDPGQSIFSSVSDMARWARLLMNMGEIDGRQVLPALAVREMRRSAIVRRGDFPANWETEFNDSGDGLQPVIYASGLMIYTYRGRTLFGHSGDELGYATLMIADPKTKVAVVVMINNFASKNGATEALVGRTLNALYGEEKTDWSQMALARQRIQLAENKDVFDKLFAVKGPEAKPLKSFTGTYEHPFCGKLFVRVEKGKLIASTGPAWDAELKPLGDGTFQGTVRGPSAIYFHVGFEPGEAGRPANLTITHPYLHRTIVFETVAG
ncbi:MAG: serine hydrolase [Sphingomonadales bacterium]|nr:serine hydrolase [Sphingomonadales bacterium]